jgi:hypothetical protein
MTDSYAITGPVAANTLATVIKGGRKYGLFEDKFATLGYYGESLDNSYWAKYRTTVTADAATDPLGGSTVDKLCETSATGTHFIEKNFTFVKWYNYTFELFIAPSDRVKIRAECGSTHTAFSDTAIFTVDSSDGTLTYVSGAYNWAKIYPLTGGGYLVKVNRTATSSAADYFTLYMMSGTSYSYTGTTGYGIYLWGVQVVQGPKVASSYLRTSTAIITKTADIGYFANNVIPLGIVNKFKIHAVPHFSIPHGIERPFWHSVGSASDWLASCGAYGMMADSTDLYFAASDKIKKVALSGGASSDIETGLTATRGLAINATNIYWADLTTGKVQTCALAGGAITDVVTGLTSPNGVALDGTYVYWICGTGGSGLLQKYPLAGGSVSTVVQSIAYPCGVAVDGAYVYFGQNTTGGSVARASIGSSSAAGGQALATSQDYVRLICVDDSTIYWSAKNTPANKWEIRAINKDGGAIRVLKDSEDEIVSIYIKEGALFWATTASSGTIRRRDSVGAFLTTAGKIKVVSGSDIKVITGAFTADMDQDITITFDRTNGKIILSGTDNDGEYTGSSWTGTGNDLYWGNSYMGVVQFNGLISEPKTK